MRKGFTSIELVIGIALFAVISGIGVMVYRNINGDAMLDESAADIVRELRVARQKSVSGVNDSAHGVYFDLNASGGDRFVVYQGSSYALRNSMYDRANILPSSITLYTTFPSHDVNFSKSEGGLLTAGTVIVTRAHGGDRSIVVNRLGIVESY